MRNNRNLFWVQLKNKDQKVFSSFFNNMYPKLFSIAYNSINNKDACLNIVQETFSKFWFVLQDITPEKGYMEAYLIKILKNKIIDYYRKNNENQIYLDDLSIETMPVCQIYPDEELEQQEVIYKMTSIAIENLPESIKDIFILSKLKGFTYKEIARDKNISVKTVEAHITKAFKILKKDLKKFL
ncbi:RNA polymerase sigma factor [Tenacibaculum sp. TC6]|uniref:RNA polymerase sigma factor n=1 Tax=Tenacibaculum sp. TC6 TaxID=3423223 RepID=UPI003D36E434